MPHRPHHPPVRISRCTANCIARYLADAAVLYDSEAGRLNSTKLRNRARLIRRIIPFLIQTPKSQQQ